MKRLAVDLVIVNERAASYVQDLQLAIEAAVRGAQSRPRYGELAQGAVYTLRADLMSIEARALLQATARVELIARRGPIAGQIAQPKSMKSTSSRPAEPARPPPAGRRHRRCRSLSFSTALAALIRTGANT
jgi:cyclic beta-1,2-glucan synthetase